MCCNRAHLGGDCGSRRPDFVFAEIVSPTNSFHRRTVERIREAVVKLFPGAVVRLIVRNVAHQRFDALRYRLLADEEVDELFAKSFNPPSLFGGTCGWF